MTAVGYTDIGSRYEENQDCYEAGKISGSLFWLALCDGMGGLADGARASRTVISSIKKFMSASLAEMGTTEEVKNLLVKAIRNGNDELVVSTMNRGTRSPMGTTVVSAVVRNSDAVVAHCGDSRAYLIHDSDIKLLTKDHSMVQELVDAGKISEEQARNHPNKNIITRALGVEFGVRIDLCEFRVEKDDIILLCSDGLTNMLNEDEIIKTVNSTDFYLCPETLVKRSLNAGGTDNITALMLRV